MQNLNPFPIAPVIMENVDEQTNYSHSDLPNLEIKSNVSDMYPNQ